MNEDLYPQDNLSTLNHETVNTSITENSEGNHLNFPHYREKIQQIIKEVEINIRYWKSELESANDPDDKIHSQIFYDQRIKSKKTIEVLLKVLDNKVNDPEDVLTAINIYLEFFNDTMRSYYFGSDVGLDITENETLMVARFLLDQINALSSATKSKINRFWFKDARDSLVSILKVKF